MPRDLDTVCAACDLLIEAGTYEQLRQAAREDRFFLGAYILRRPDLKKQWLLERCDEVQANPNEHLDLWARYHYKSTIITFVGLIADVINNPEITIAIFSHTRPIAKAFLRQIKRELEQNELLKGLFPEIFYDDPAKEAPSWSEDNGICVKRQGNPKENTIEAWGLVDGQPTSKHYKLRLYDDIVTMDGVTNEEMRNKVLEALEMSFNLGEPGGHSRYAGTRYHFADAYAELIRRGSITPRIYPVVDKQGRPVLLSVEDMTAKRAESGPVVWASQMMLNPISKGSINFAREWLRHYHDDGRQPGNNYILVDPANKKTKRSDYTCIMVVTWSGDRKRYVRDIIRDKLGLMQRTKLIFALYRKWTPIKVLYEEYGMQTDIESIQWRMEEEKFRFEIQPMGGNMGKEDRIAKLIPPFEQGNIYLPHTCMRYVEDSGKLEDMTRIFIDEEYSVWPFSGHDDMLDTLARLEDKETGMVYPMATEGWGAQHAMRPQVAIGTGEISE